MSSSNQQPSAAATWNAQLYDGQLAFVAEFGKGAVDWLGPLEGRRVLDLGCGTGDLTAELAGRGADVHGVDASAEMLEAARSKYPQLQFTEADAQDLRIHPAQYDIVFSNAALHWMKRPSDVISGVWDALRPGGRFVGEFGARGNVAHIEAALTRALRRRGIDAAARNPWYFPSAGEYAARLEAQGFVVRRIATFDRPTLLNGGARAIRIWVEMFGESFLQDLSPQEREQAFSEMEIELRPSLYSDTQGGWIGDYVRLRFEAEKPKA
ncbi:class I SAM-dependent methyltransferase [Paenibacillus koleovorans]|uniref:class I SAM-dependent methyltransferase n=1 Tax=Paenibacillus koleovorans TaxID=121608 RepID=UPI000FDCC872|nr:class I SAM-dependent methyltransferase [Paenibacillus koleovorans]